MANGQSLFMSNETMQELDDDMFNNRTPQVSNLEIPLNFERFDGAKTASIKWQHGWIVLSRTPSLKRVTLVS